MPDIHNHPALKQLIIRWNPRDQPARVTCGKCFVTLCVIYVAPSLDPSQWPGELVPHGCKKLKKRRFSQYKCSPPDVKAGPGASSGLGWRKPKDKRSISILLVPCPTPPSLSFCHLRLGLCLALVQQKKIFCQERLFALSCWSWIISSDLPASWAESEGCVQGAAGRCGL